MAARMAFRGPAPVWRRPPLFSALPFRLPRVFPHGRLTAPLALRDLLGESVKKEGSPAFWP